MRMSKYFKNTTFSIGFWLGLCLFIFLNYLSCIISYDKYVKSQQEELVFSVGYYGGGFPLHFYHEHIGNPNFSEFYWTVVFVDILIGLFFSFVLGFIFKFLWSKIVARKLK